MGELGRIAEVQQEASRIGYRMLVLGHYSIDGISNDIRQEVRGLGLDLHLIETTRVLHDGGISLRGIQERIARCSERLTVIIAFRLSPVTFQ